MKALIQVAASLALATAFVLPVSAQEERSDSPPNGQSETTQDQAKKTPQDQAKKQEQPQENQVRKLKIITLKNRDPQQLQQILALRDGGMQGFAGPATSRQSLAAARARAAGQAAGAEAQEEPKVSIAVDGEGKLLFIRGSEAQIEELEKLVKALDVKDEALEPLDFAGHRLIPIRSDKASQVQTTLSQLDLRGNVMRIGETTLIVFRTDEANAEESRQAEEVVKQLNAQTGSKTEADASKKSGTQKKASTSNQAGTESKTDASKKAGTQSKAGTPSKAAAEAQAEADTEQKGDAE